MRTIPIMSDSIENTVQSLKYSKTTLAKKQETHATHIYLALRLIPAQSNTSDGEISDQSQIHDCPCLPLR
jgi:hypothetical protein